jgi:hypothetical protein
MRTPQNSISPKVNDRSGSPQGENPCLGIALGRRTLWAVLASPIIGSPDIRHQVEWSEHISLGEVLFEGDPSLERVTQLTKILTSLFEKTKGTYTTFQVALPDPLVKFEVFELEKVPDEGKAMGEFLTWRFNKDQKENIAPPAFTRQLLGMEGGKSLVLGMAVEPKWLQVLQQAFDKAGIPVSVMDMALGYRFNLFHDAFQANGGSGALLSFEPEYWSLALWDRETRLRFARYKWWKGDRGKSKEIPLLETVLEAERTIRSYVYSNKNRSVEKIFVLSPEEWLEPVLEALRERTEGNCEGLSLNRNIFQMHEAGLRGIAPSALATAVKR